MALNEEQRKAVEYLNGPLLVLAGPGTGKTQILSQKVAYILENTDTNPENILCLTFTDAGKENMRERLLSIVGGSANDVNIHTYHSFGSYILTQYKNYAENFDRNLDDAIDTVTQFKIIKSIQEKLPALDIIKNSNIPDILSTISDAKSSRLYFSDLKKIAETNLNDSAKINNEVSSILIHELPILRSQPNSVKYEYGLQNIYLPVAKVLEKYASKESITKGIKREANTLLESLNLAVEEGIHYGKNGNPSIAPLTKWKDSNFEKDYNENYILSSRIANKKLLSISFIMESYDEYLRQNNLFDFADMIQQSIHFLKEDNGFRATLSERYQFILLDEFQDTNPSQFELVNLLVSGQEAPNIMAVGDDEQAIYEFQGASASSLSNFKNEFNAKVITLTKNYRSTQEILDFSRHIADQLDVSFAKSEGVNKKLSSINNDLILNGNKGQTHIHRHEFLNSDAEFSFIAKEIRKMIDDGVEPKDIAVITSKHKYIAPILPHLKRQKINVTYEKRENILEDHRIHELMMLSRFIYGIAKNNNPSYMMMEILTYKFFQIPAVEIVKSLQSSYNDKRKPLDYLLGSENENLKKIGTFFAELVADSFDTPLEKFIDMLTGIATTSSGIKSPFIDYYANSIKDFSTFNLYENLSVLREIIEKHVKVDRPRLSDLISFLDDYEEAGESILNKSPYQDNSNSVQVMTAHKSKGLEFKHVFLTSVDDINWGKGKGNNNLLTLPKNVIQIRNTGNTDDEKLRVFFVAITRAQMPLTLTSSSSDFAGKAPNRLAYLSEHIGDNNVIVSPFVPEGHVISHDDFGEAQKSENSLIDSWIYSYLSPEEDLREQLENKLKSYKMSASDLTKFIDVVFAGPLEFYRAKLIGGPNEPTSLNINFGDLIHEIFENITNQKISDQEAIDLYLGKVDKQDIPDSDKESLKSRGIISLKASLKSFGDILRAEDSKDRKSTRLNSSHQIISYAVFCL